jgi:hypothetical protein
MTRKGNSRLIGFIAVLLGIMIHKCSAQSDLARYLTYDKGTIAINSEAVFIHNNTDSTENIALYILHQDSVRGQVIVCVFNHEGTGLLTFFETFAVLDMKLDFERRPRHRRYSFLKVH